VAGPDAANSASFGLHRHGRRGHVVRARGRRPRGASVIPAAAQERTIIARWTPDSAGAAGSAAASIRLSLHWCSPEVVHPSTAVLAGIDDAAGGAWAGRYGAAAAWLPAITSDGPQNGHRAVVTQGQVCVWADSSLDARAALVPGTGPAAKGRATCWFADRDVDAAISPPDRRPYRLTLYLLDFDGNGRAETVELSDETGVRHEVAWKIVTQAVPDVTGCPITRTLRGIAAR